MDSPIPYYDYDVATNTRCMQSKKDALIDKEKNENKK